MYKLKQIPEDFIVKEVTDRKFTEEGIYLVCSMTKKNYNTEDAIRTICRALKVIRKNVSYAGTKDRNAITHQYISFFKGREERIKDLQLKDISLEVVGRTNSPLSLGDLKGNNFEITVRNIEVPPKKLDKFPNFYDSQRFSENNVEVGRRIVKKDFKGACEILQEDRVYGDLIKNELEKSNKNYSTAIRQLPSKILLLYTHAYQSYIWNKTVEALGDKVPEKVPLIGFGTDLDESDTSKAIKKIMEDEKITFRDFIIREIPEASLEGTDRNTYMKIENLEISQLEEDELNKDKKKILVKFFLEKGAYATMAIKHLFTS